MSKSKMYVFHGDGTSGVETYDARYDIKIHCKDQAEHDRIIDRLRRLKEIDDGQKHPKFTVIDKKTGKEVDIEAVAARERWAKGLMYHDMDGFAIQEDGTLILTDECEHFKYCPLGLFEVKWDV